MTELIPTPPTISATRRFHNVAEWLHDLGDVSPSRILMDPWPGTATEADLLQHIENYTLCELIDGTLVEKPEGLLESLIAARLITFLNMFVLPRDLGYVTGEGSTLRMKSGRVRLPDVAYFAYADLPGGAFPQQRVPQITPTIAAEVLSEPNTSGEMAKKRGEYFSSGSKLVWLICPVTRTIEVFDRTPDEPTRVIDESGVLDGGSALPGFLMNVADLFKGLSTIQDKNG